MRVTLKRDQTEVKGACTLVCKHKVLYVYEVNPNPEKMADRGVIAENTRVTSRGELVDFAVRPTLVQGFAKRTKKGFAMQNSLCEAKKG